MLDSSCSALTLSGAACGMPARIGSSPPVCINHDPAYQDTQRANAAAGGYASGLARQPLSLSELDVDCSDREGIQATIEALIKLELLGRIAPARSRNILRALTIAYHNFDAPLQRDPHYPSYQPLQSKSMHNATRIEKARHTLAARLVEAIEESSARDADLEHRDTMAKLALRPAHTPSLRQRDLRTLAAFFPRPR